MNDDIIARFIAADLHSHLFFEEFTFARTQFSPAGTSEVELADAVVLLGDTLLVFQIKERSPTAVGDAEAEGKWFQSKVQKRATGQIRDTLRFLQSQSSIEVANERGRIFNLAANDYPEIIKVVLYSAPPAFPSKFRLIKHHVSETAGFMHIVDAEAYAKYAQLLGVPEEIVRYFRYREEMLTRFPDHCKSCTEADFVGAFVGHDETEPPTTGAAKLLNNLVRDEQDWDITPFLRGLRDHISSPNFSDDYYGILREFARLPRSFWKEAKLRINLCIEHATTDQFERPYRFSDSSRRCGFVFVPVHSELSTHHDWDEMKMRGLMNFTILHKHDQRLERCVGVMVAKVGKIFDIQWCLAEFPWQEDQELDQKLQTSFPFRPVSEQTRFSYFINES